MSIDMLTLIAEYMDMLLVQDVITGPNILGHNLL